MKDNTILMLVAELAVCCMSVAAMCNGQVELAAVGVGAMAGMIGGHLNGTHKE